MKTLLTVVLSVCLLIPGEDSLVVMFWNLENFFDWKGDGFEEGRHWTRKRFLRKCQAISKAVHWIADQEGGVPDVIGLAEVENTFVLERLLDETSLYRYGYRIVHFDSPDPRGIDVALLYRSPRLELLSARPLRVSNRGGPELRTRDILLAEFVSSGGDTLAFLVNHHPSKYGGDSDWKREAALGRLREATDSLAASGRGRIVAMGDFNDTPEAMGAYSERMVNLAAPLALKGEGTIKYSGRWEMIDMFFVSPAMAAEGVRMKVVKVPFLIVRDSAHSGEKPLRTYSGPRYLGGVSDHLPIVLDLH